MKISEDEMTTFQNFIKNHTQNTPRLKKNQNPLKSYEGILRFC